MDQVLIDIRDESEQIKRIFKNKDIVSIESLLSKIEELDDDKEYLEEKIQDMETPDEPDYYKEWRDNQI